jgi:AcrR family transcriptional regulator
MTSQSIKKQSPASNPPPTTTPPGDSTPDAHGPRRHLPAEARREQILRAALTCFGEKGYHAATMDDLVRASGLSKGSLYLHFRSKEEVFLALFDAFAAEFYRDWDAAAESGEDAIEVLRRECEIIVQSFSRERVFLLAWVEFLSHPVARERMRETYAIARMKLETIIERGREAGSIQPGPDAGLIAGSLVGAVEGLLLQWLVDPDFDVNAHLDVVWELLMRGLCA